MERTIILPLVFGAVLLAQQRPGLLFREDWKETPPETPITQAHVANNSLTLNLYGPGASGLKKSHHDQPADDPYYFWSGTAEGNWVASLRHRAGYADLTGLARIRWRAKQAGFHELRVALKLADGTWIVGDPSDGASSEWRVRDFPVSDLRWRRLDIRTVTEGEWVEAPELGRVDEIGWTDLMRGGQSAACSRLDWIEVYARPVGRK
mgnify:CR=1 FL=1